MKLGCQSLVVYNNLTAALSSPAPVYPNPPVLIYCPWYALCQACHSNESLDCLAMNLLSMTFLFQTEMLSQTAIALNPDNASLLIKKRASNSARFFVQLYHLQCDFSERCLHFWIFCLQTKTSIFRVVKDEKLTAKPHSP